MKDDNGFRPLERLGCSKTDLETARRLMENKNCEIFSIKSVLVCKENRTVFQTNAYNFAFVVFRDGNKSLLVSLHRSEAKPWPPKGNIDTVLERITSFEVAGVCGKLFEETRLKRGVQISLAENLMFFI